MHKLILKTIIKLHHNRLLSERDRRRLKRAIKKLRQSDPNFSVMEIVKASGINMKCASYRTFLRYIRTLGYGYYDSRRKGVLTGQDLKKRKKFAREALKKQDDYWTKEIAFYLDEFHLCIKATIK